MQSFSHSKAVPVLSLSAVQSNSIPMSPAERLDFEAAINRAFISGLEAHRNRLRKQSASQPFAEVCP